MESTVLTQEKMEKTILTKEEIEQLSSLQKQQDSFIIQLGQIEYQKKMLSQQKEKIHTDLTSFETTQTQIAQQLEEKYGKGTINLESGEFIKS